MRAKDSVHKVGVFVELVIQDRVECLQEIVNKTRMTLVSE